jgi:succinoglycan biosynthesis transport protein ExoP
LVKDDTVELRWILAVLRRRALLILGCSLVVGLIAFAIALRLPVTYQSSTTLLVLPNQDASTSEYNALEAGTRLALTYSQLLKDRTMLQSVIAQLGLRDSAEGLAKRMRVEPVKDTQLIRVTVEDPSPVAAVETADAIVDAFAARVKDLQEERYSAAIAAIEAAQPAAERGLKETQTQVGALGAAKIAAETELARLTEELVQYRNDARSVQQTFDSAQLAAAQAANRVQIVDAAVPSDPAQTAGPSDGVLLMVDPASTSLVGTYVEMLTRRPVLEAAIDELHADLTVEALAQRVEVEPITNTQLIRLRVTGSSDAEANRIAGSIARQFISQTQTLLSSAYTQQMAGLQTQIDNLARQTDATQARIAALTAENLQRDQELERLQPQLADERDNARSLQQDAAQLRLTAATLANTVMVTERARPPGGPARSNSPYILLAVALAAIVAAGAAFLLENLDETIKTPEEISDQLGLSSLATICRFHQTRKLVVVEDPQSPAAEVFKVLAANVRLCSLGGPLHTLVVTSSGAAEGKSAISANLAAALAHAGLRVVAVDADLRHPTLHEFFHLGQAGGLTDALLHGGVMAYLRPTEVEGLRVLTSGPLPPDPVGVISSPGLVGLLAELAQATDVVVIDSPPVLAMADTTVLAAAADGILLVIRAGQTWRRSARHAIENLRRTRARLVGAVLNAPTAAHEGYGPYRYAYRQSRNARVRAALLAPQQWLRGQK